MYAKTIQRDKSWFENLFLPFIDGLYHLALRMTRNAADAENLVEQSFLKAYRFYNLLQAETNAKIWIFTIMINDFRTKYRGRHKESNYTKFREVEKLFALEKHKTFIQPGDKSAAYDNEKDFKFIKSLKSDDIVNALESIPEQIRMALLLSDGEQFSYHEVAELIGTSIGTAKSRIFIGRKVLRKQLFEFALARRIC